MIFIRSLIFNIYFIFPALTLVFVSLNVKDKDIVYFEEPKRIVTHTDNNPTYISDDQRECMTQGIRIRREE